MRTINDAGLDLIKSFEGCRLTAYKDQVGVYTIGYGHTGDVTGGEEITQEEANSLLAKDLGRFESGVSALVTWPDINDNQFSALVSFAFNLGLGALKSSTLLRCVNTGHASEAGSEFLKWCRAGGIENPGLLRRRQAEKALFELNPGTGPR